MQVASVTWTENHARIIGCTVKDGPNERAIRFYQRYGFRTTGERELGRGKLPNVRMTRESELGDKIT